jgi:hypothetical protein
MRRVLLWVAIFCGHAAAQLTAWVFADARLHPAGALFLFHVLGFPVFAIAGSFADLHFWLAFVANSACWATALTWFMLRRAAER